jgi:hypothetical protein
MPINEPTPGIKDRRGRGSAENRCGQGVFQWLTYAPYYDSTLTFLQYGRYCNTL